MHVREQIVFERYKFYSSNKGNGRPDTDTKTHPANYLFNCLGCWQPVKWELWYMQRSGFKGVLRVGRGCLIKFSSYLLLLFMTINLTENDYWDTNMSPWSINMGYVWFIAAFVCVFFHFFCRLERYLLIFLCKLYKQGYNRFYKTPA